MAVNHAQRLARVLIKIAEDPQATIEQKLEASSQLADLLGKKPAPAHKKKPRSSSVLG